MSTTTEPALDADFQPVAVREAAPPVSWTPSFAVAVDDAIARKQEKRRFFEKVMDKDLHYGVIPGTGTKPTLLKPGAEMLLSNMGLNATFVDAEAPIIDVLGSDHGGEAYIRYRRICRIYRQLGPQEHERMIVAEAGGSCSSWETKYRYRNDQRKCPECGKATIIVGKPEYGGGFVCFKKKGGCGAKFKGNDAAITEQSTGKIPNPDVAELENTILKMADKRALVAATLIATGCSDIFTQDAPGEDDLPSSGERDDEPGHGASHAGTTSSRVEASNEPVNRDPKAPGSISERSAESLARGLAILGGTSTFSLMDELALFSQATEGRVTDANISLLSEQEARRLGKLLKPLLDEIANDVDATRLHVERGPAEQEMAELPL